MAADQDRQQAFPNDPRLFELLAKSKSGCSDSLGELLAQFRPFLLQVANQRLPVPMQSKLGGSDIVQQSFLNASQAFDQFQGETIEELTSWLVRIVVNNALSMRRHFCSDKRNTGREVRLSDGSLSGINSLDIPSDGSTPSHRMLTQERRERIQRTLASLPAEYRIVLELRNKNELTFAEIGAALNRSPDVARKLWARAAETLAKMIRSLDESG